MRNSTLRIATAAAITFGMMLSSCGTLEKQFGRIQTVDIWDSHAFSEDDERLSRHAEALNDAEGLLGATPGARGTAAFVWSQERSARADDDAFGRVGYRLELTPGSLPGTFAEPLSPSVYQRLIVQHARDRVRQIDTACLGYFRTLETFGSGSRFFRDAVNILADYSSILLGLSESATKPLAILAGSRAALDSTLSSAETLLLLNPAPMQTYLLVRTSQEASLIEANVSQFERYTEAALFIEQYAYQCTPLGIRQIISNAVDEQVRRTDPSVTTTAGQALLAQIQSALSSAREGEAVAELSSSDAAFLAILLDQWNCAGEQCLDPQKLRAQTPDPLLFLLPPENALGADLTLGTSARTRVVQLLGALEQVQPSFGTRKLQTAAGLARPPQPAATGALPGAVEPSRQSGSGSTEASSSSEADEADGDGLPT